MRIDGPQITGSFSIGNTTFPDVNALATTGSNTFVGNQVISGSIVSTQTTLISGSSQVLSGTGIFSSSAQLPSGIISGSSQLPTGIVSSSAQVIVYGVSTTGSNILQGNQTITGSLFISENLIVAGSSSIQHISSSVVNINDNIITVNALNPSVRFGGLAVIDSGSSPQVSGSMLFDSINNQWLFVHQNQGTVTSSVLLMGPETYNNLGNETYITQNRLVKSTGIEHLSDSNITDTGTKVSINSNTEVTGSITATEGRFYQPLTNTTSFLTVENNRARNAAIRLKTTVGDYYLGTGIGADVNQFQLYDGTIGENRLVISSTGAATFSSSVTANGISSIGQEQAFTFQRTTGTPSDVYSLNADSGASYLYNNTTANTLMIWREGGNVGIGAFPSNSKLLVAGTHVSGNSIIGVLPVGNNTATIGLYNASGVRRGLFYSDSGFVRVESDADQIQIVPAGVTALTATTGGNVGIGITNPFSRLHVRNSNTSEGTIAIGHETFPGLIYSSASTGEFRIDNRSSAASGYISFYPNGQQNTLGGEAMRIIPSGNVLIGTTSSPTLSTPHGGKLLMLPNAVIVSGIIAFGPPYTQNIQIDIVYGNWGSNSVIGLVDMIITLREYAHTSGTAFGKIFATNSAQGATFTSFNTTDVTISQCSITATSGGSYTLRITIDPSNVTDRGSFYLVIPSGGGTASEVSSITVSYV